MRLVDELAPRWVVVENVPGLLSSNGGRDMGTVLGTLGDLGYGWAYRVLDAQYFGLAQRRKRVFIVGCLGDPAGAAEILFEPDSCGGDIAPSRASGQGVASALTGGFGSGGPDDNCAQAGWLIPEVTIGFSHTHCVDCQPSERAWPTLRREGGGHAVAYRKSARVNADPDSPETWVADGVANTLNGFDVGDVRTTHAVVAPTPLLEVGARTGTSTDDPRAGMGVGEAGDPMFTLQAGKQHGIGAGMTVRRLTPVECERLQGFPDNWTAGLSDSARYRTLGNAVAVPVAEWIGRRIKENDQ